MSRAGAFLAAVGGGCLTAAGIYPASRYRRSRPTIVEAGALAAGGGVVLSALGLPQRRARDVVAIAWPVCLVLAYEVSRRSTELSPRP